jgi:hypothetical protein
VMSFREAGQGILVLFINSSRFEEGTGRHPLFCSSEGFQKGRAHGNTC